MRLVQATALLLVVILTACGSGNDVTTALSCSDLADWSSPGIAFTSVEEAPPEEGPGALQGRPARSTARSGSSYSCR